MANTELPFFTWVQIIGQPYLCLVYPLISVNPGLQPQGTSSPHVPFICRDTWQNLETLLFVGVGVLLIFGEWRPGIYIWQHTQLFPTVWECPVPNVNGAKMEKPSAKPSTWNALPFSSLPPSCPPCIIFFQALQKFPSPVKSSQPCSLLSYCFNFFVWSHKVFPNLC